VAELGEIADGGICLIQVAITPTENMASKTLAIGAGVWPVTLEGQDQEVIDAAGKGTRLGRVLPKPMTEPFESAAVRTADVLDCIQTPFRNATK